LGTIHIAAVRLSSGGSATHHITSVVFVEPSFKGGACNTADLIKWLDQGNVAKVNDGKTAASVEVVRPQSGNPYIRTTPDKTKTDNLLSIPRY
jgi:hypothetical protein